MSLISLIKLDLGELIVDNEKKIFIIKFSKENFIKDQFFTLLEYFKNFWLLAKEQNIKYYMLFDIKELGIYPLNRLEEMKNVLINLESIFLKSLHCSCLLTDNDIVITILKPLFNMYKAVRPFSIFKTKEEVYSFYAQSKNQN